MDLGICKTQYKVSLTVRVEQGWAKFCLFASAHCILFSHITYNWYVQHKIVQSRSVIQSIPQALGDPIKKT